MRTIPSRLSILAAALLAAPAAQAAVSVTVHDDVVVHTVRPDFTGVNFCAYYTNMGADPATLNDMHASDFRLVRFPGGIPCDWYDYTAPLSAGNRTISEAWQIASEAGGKLLYQTNIYDAGGTGQNTPATVQAIDAYMKAHGIQVAMWEGGNEPEYGPHKALPASTYMAEYNTAFGAQYTALKAVSPSIPMIGPGTTSLGNLALFLAAHGNKSGDGKVDGVSFHWYAGGGFTNDPSYQRNAAQTSLPTLIASIKSTIATYDTRDLPIYITEWNWINPGGWGDYDYTFVSVNDADCVGAMMQLGVAGSTQFDLQVIAQSYGMISNFDGYRTPHAHDVNSVFYALTLAQKLGTSVLQVDNPADAGSSLGAYATKTADGNIQVMLCNKDYANAQDVTLSFSTYDPNGKAIEIDKLENHTGLWSVNASELNGVLFPQPQSSGIFPAPAAATGNASTYSVHLPAFGSMQVLIFAGGSGTTTSGTTTSGTTTSGSTTGGSATAGTATAATAGTTGAANPNGGQPKTQCGLGSALGIVLGALALWRRRAGEHR